MNDDFIEWYDTFNTEVCLEDLIFGGFNDQPIPSTYSDLTNDYGNDGTKIDASLTDNEGVEDAVMPNDKKNNDNRFASDIDTPHTIFWKLK